MSIFDGIQDFLGFGGGDPAALARNPAVSGEPAVPQAPQTFNDRLMNPMTQAGLALLANNGTRRSDRGAFEGVGEALTGAARLQEAKAEKNKTKAFLRQNYPHIADQVEAGLDVGRAFAMAMQEQQFGQEMAQRERLAKGRGESLTADRRNFLWAQEDPKYAEFLARQGGRGSTGGSKGSNAPSGFRWADPEQTRLEPIPGGPGEQIGGENAGRIGISDSFLRDLPSIRQEVNKGGVTGAVDATLGRVGYGEQGRLYARIESGADALQRMLSGAGMPESEAKAYARRYMPSATDSSDIVNQKLDQLERELTAQRNVVLRGRGGAGSSFSGSDISSMSDADLEAIANGQ